MSKEKNRGGMAVSTVQDPPPIALNPQISVYHPHFSTLTVKHYFTSVWLLSNSKIKG